MSTVATVGSDAPVCRVCGSGDTGFVFEVESTYPHGERQRRFFACTRCGTLIDALGVGPSYTADASGPELTDHVPHVKFYLEVGAGIESFATILCLVRRALGPRHDRPHARLLEVGAGFGFLVSMARSLGWEAVGVEPSGMGRLGGCVLDVPILPRLLEDSDLPPGTFDCVISSEVIEHVTEPRAFAASLARYVAPDGVLVLTTPNGEVLRGGAAAEREWLETLSPGQHLNLLSPAALTLLLGELGLRDVRVVLTGGSSGRKQLLAVAAKEPGIVSERLDWDESCREGQTLTLEYLEDLVRSRETTGIRDALYRGALFRLARSLVDRREYTRGLLCVRKLDDLLRADGLSEEVLSAFAPTGFDDYITRVPGFAGLHYYYRGMLELNHIGDATAARRSFALAARLCQLEDSLGFFPRAGWFERARAHEGLALLRAERRPEAIAVFDSLLAQREHVPAEVLDLIAREKIGAHLDLHDAESPEHVPEEPAQSTRTRDVSDEARFTRVLDVLSRPRGLVRRLLGREGKARR